jgi:hypothetical protein
MRPSDRKLVFRIGGLTIIAAALAFVGWLAWMIVAAFITVVLEIK